MAVKRLLRAGAELVVGVSVRGVAEGGVLVLDGAGAFTTATGLAGDGAVGAGFPFAGVPTAAPLLPTTGRGRFELGTPRSVGVRLLFAAAFAGTTALGMPFCVAITLPLPSAGAGAGGGVPR